MGRARHAWLLWLAAFSLLWACCHATAVMAQGARRTADLRSGALEPPPEPASSAPRPASSDPLIPDASLAKIFERGGMLMWPLLMCSVVTMVFVFERAICLRRGNILPRPFVTRFLLQLEDGQLTPTDALKRCQENGSPIALVFAAAVRKWGRSSVEVEQAMIDAGERVAATLRRNLRVLNTIHTVGPLLGLLGTVLGIIRCFNKIAASKTMGRPDLLADGMSEALLTTAAGLCVAIPALCFYLYFSSCADRRIIEIDALGQQVVQLISGDSPLATAPRSKPSSKKVA
jgi:biopolymer transport protein ExbB